MLRKSIMVLATAVTLIAGTMGVAAPAQARVSTGAGVVAGILGIGVGAAIASDHPHQYHDGGYFAPPPPPPAPVYYAPPPPPPLAYAYEYVQRCRVVDRWEPYYGRYVRDRRCY